jgi:nicotinamide-nucleotide amidase
MSEPIRTAAIVSTGDEIVGGRTVDTNSSWLADKLAGLGIDVTAFLAVSDDVDRIAWAWRSAADKADLVISTGGLGPTSDDLTTEAVASVAGAALELDEAEADRIREFFQSRGRTMPETNLRQALLPVGSTVIPNPVGTAPGYRIEIPRADGGRCVGMVFPGVPREMKPMFKNTALPWIASQTDPGRVVVAQTFSTFGAPESSLDEKLRGAVPPGRSRLSFRASFPKISVRVSVAGPEELARRELATLAAGVRARISDFVYADGDASMEEVVGALLRSQRLMLASAESCTGGMIGSRITDVAGSSAYYSGGIVAYSNDLKQRLLGVGMKTLGQYGAVSEETAREMAAGALAAGGADIAVATTGIAGPDGGTADKPVGTVAIALARKGRPAESRLYKFRGDRDWVKILTTQVALDWIRRSLLGLPPLEPGAITPARRGTA